MPTPSRYPSLDEESALWAGMALLLVLFFFGACSCQSPEISREVEVVDYFNDCMNQMYSLCGGLYVDPNKGKLDALEELTVTCRPDHIRKCLREEAEREAQGSAK